jgi:hypothetical protein
MPRALFAPHCRAARPTLADVSALADVFRTSLTTAALRFAALASCACAAVLSRDGIVEWCEASDAFAVRIHPRARPGGASYARLVFAGESAPPYLAHVDPRAWDADAPDVDLHEHARALPGGAVLSWLWHGAS